MKKIVVSAFLLVMMSFAVQAQNTGSADLASRRSGKMTKKERHKLIKDLHLTHDQKVAWKNSKKDFKIQQMAVKSNTSLTEIQRKEQLRALKRERMEKMRTLLTPQQIRTFQEETRNR